MKILHIIDIPWWSGLAVYAFDCMSAHKNSGNEVWVACMADSLVSDHAAESGFKLISIKGRENRNAIQNLFTIGKTVSKNKPDWIVAHTGSTHWIAVFWGKIYNIPVIRTRATSQKFKSGLLSKKTYQACRQVVFASDHLRKECIQIFGLLNHEKFITIYPPSDVSKQNEVPNNQNKKIGIVARLDPIKGLESLVESAKLVQKLEPKTEFHLAGAEENIRWHTLLKQIEKNNLKNFYYHGLLSKQQTRQLMNDCNIGVIASLGSEEVSRALMEWMSAGRPVVATRVGSIPEILKNGEGGYLVPPNEPGQMALKLLELLKNRDRAQTMGKANQNQMLEKFSRAHFEAQWSALLTM